MADEAPQPAGTDPTPEQVARQQRHFAIALCAGLPAGFIVSNLLNDALSGWPHWVRLLVSSLAAGVAVGVVLLPVYAALRNSRR